ncbi:MAG: DUF1192 domain-containing protein [Pseudomonadota bacterium]
MEEEDVTPSPAIFQIGQALELLSVEEINETIEILAAEIERLKAAATAKQAHLSAADALFSKR